MKETARVGRVCEEAAATMTRLTEALEPFVAYFAERRQVDDDNWRPAVAPEPPGFYPTSDYGRTMDAMLDKAYGALALLGSGAGEGAQR